MVLLIVCILLFTIFSNTTLIAICVEVIIVSVAVSVTYTALYVIFEPQFFVSVVLLLMAMNTFQSQYSQSPERRLTQSTNNVYNV